MTVKHILHFSLPLLIAACCGCSEPPKKASALEDSETIFHLGRALVLKEDATAEERAAGRPLLERAAELGHEGAKDLLWALGGAAAPAPAAAEPECLCEGEHHEM